MKKKLMGTVAWLVMTAMIASPAMAAEATVDISGENTAGTSEFEVFMAVISDEDTGEGAVLMSDVQDEDGGTYAAGGVENADIEFSDRGGA